MTMGIHRARCLSSQVRTLRLGKQTETSTDRVFMAEIKDEPWVKNVI